MAKITRRYTLTIVWESSSDYEEYLDQTVDPPRKMSEAEARRCDEEAILDDPFMCLDNATISVKIEDLL